MKDREESSIECLRLTVRIRYSLYRISFLAHPPTLMIPHKTHTHTFVCVCVFIWVYYCLIALVKHLDMFIQNTLCS